MAGDKWLSKQNVITMASMVVGVILAIGTVAIANPAGQRMLCGASGFFCEDVQPLELVATGEAMDFDAWCREVVAGLEALPELERPPGVGAVPSAADCATTLDSPEAERFTRPLDTLDAGARDYLTANLSFQHGAVREPLAFTIRTLCGYTAPGARSWTALPCTLTADLAAGNSLDYYRDAGPLPSGTVEAALTPNQLYFSQTWRLEINSLPTAAELPRGAYQVNLRIANDAESLKESSARFEFTVE
ncbi:MAG: hypothetical protein SGJ21_00895 [Alphaproteobacteria bacterium]|nr:hypothetical protein [Alphaproteobacteria bacterium]